MAIMVIGGMDIILKPPFSVIRHSGMYVIVDSNGMNIIHYNRNRKFVERLCRILNDNASGLKKAWIEGMRLENDNEKDKT